MQTKKQLRGHCSRLREKWTTVAEMKMSRHRLKISSGFSVSRTVDGWHMEQEARRVI